MKLKQMCICYLYILIGPWCTGKIFVIVIDLGLWNLEKHCTYLNAYIWYILRGTKCSSQISSIPDLWFFGEFIQIKPLRQHFKN